MAIRRDAIGDIVVIHLLGGFYGGQETEDLQEAIGKEAGGGNTRLVLDLTDCHRLSSLAIGVLVQAAVDYRAQGGEVKLCGTRRTLMHSLDRLGVTSRFDHHPTEEQAIAAFGGPAPPG
jgi:anti-anti-sigma factor